MYFCEPGAVAALIVCASLLLQIEFSSPQSNLRPAVGPTSSRRPRPLPGLNPAYLFLVPPPSTPPTSITTSPAGTV